VRARCPIKAAPNGSFALWKADTSAKNGAGPEKPKTVAAISTSSSKAPCRPRSSRTAFYIRRNAPPQSAEARCRGEAKAGVDKERCLQDDANWRSIVAVWNQLAPAVVRER
jgi:hypothetical protein